MDTGAHMHIETRIDLWMGQVSMDRQMDSWMLSLAVPPPPPQCLGTTRPCSMAPTCGPKAVLGDKAP